MSDSSYTDLAQRIEESFAEIEDEEMCIRDRGGACQACGSFGWIGHGSDFKTGIYFFINYNIGGARLCKILGQIFK